MKSIKSWHPVDEVCFGLIYQNELQSLDELAKKSFLCTRQFIRKFEQRTGVSPKLFDRIVRFDKAYRLKNNKPDMDWFAVAIDSGHYDYQHLAKDYKDFTGHSPVSYYEIDKKAPERSFGLHFG